jgi:hypothetical protein
LIDSIEALGLMMDDTISMNMDKFIENLDKNVYTALNEIVEESEDIMQFNEISKDCRGRRVWVAYIQTN